MLGVQVSCKVTHHSSKGAHIGNICSVTYLHRHSSRAKVAIGIVRENSKPARSEESCRGQCQRRHLHPTARSRSILHHRPRRAPEQLPTQLTFQIFLTPGYAWLSVDLIKLKHLPAHLKAGKACIWILSAGISMCCAIWYTSIELTSPLKSVRSHRSVHRVQ